MTFSAKLPAQLPAQLPAGEFPFWLRVVLLAGVLLIVIGVGLIGYRAYARPVTLTVAIGPPDTNAGAAMSAIAGRLALMDAPFRLKLVRSGDVPSAAAAFSAGQTDLALLRADFANVPDARSVLLVAHNVVLLVAPPGSSIAAVADLRGHKLGVVGGAINRKIVDAIRAEYDLGADMTVTDVTLSDARRAMAANEFDALLFTISLNEKNLTTVKSLFPRERETPVLIPIDSAGAIAEAQGAYESFDLPKGTLRGAPPVPDDDLTTLRTAVFLVASKKLGTERVAGLTQAIMEARSSLLSEQPELSSIAAPDNDPDAYIPEHPGASAYFNGNQQSFMDRYGNAIYLTPMILGGLASVFAAAWRFLGIRRPQTSGNALSALYALPRRIRTAGSETDLAAIEEEIDDMLKEQLAMSASRDGNALDISTLNAAAHRLDNLIHHRRVILAANAAPR